MTEAVCSLIEQFLAERSKRQCDSSLPACDVTVRVEPADDDSLDHDMELIIQTAALKMVSVVLALSCFASAWIDCGGYLTKFQTCAHIIEFYFHSK